MAKNQLVDRFIKSIKQVANELDKEPGSVTRAQYLNSTIKGLNDWELRKLGGFSNAIKLHFPIEEDEGATTGSKMIRKHRDDLTKKVGKDIFVTEELKSVLKDVLEKNPITFHKPVKKLKVEKKSGKDKSRTLIANLSDTHYGCNVMKSEVQVNEFNWTIASRRTALFCEQIVNYKPQYRKDTDLVLCLNGDNIAGMIHDQEWFAALWTIQYAGALSILTQAAGYLAQYFNKVSIKCSPGNHGRAMHKTAKDRALTHKWDSYETMIFIALKHILEGKYANVSVDVPTTPYVVFEAQGHRFFQTHGDTVVNVGNPGKNINIKSINEQINKLNASEIGGPHKFDAVIVGHVHVPTTILLDSGTELVINGCLSGLDPFALGIGIFSSNPTQVFFEATKNHAVGDIRKIQLKAADNNHDLDKIIKPFKGNI